MIDVINLAGGLKDDANTINLNLSKKITDEMYIIIYTNSELESYKRDNKESEVKCVSLECICPNKENNACVNSVDAPINEESGKVSNKVSINTAKKDELMSLDGIGEAKANSIILYRETNGLFNNIEDIKNVSGISDKVYEKIKDNITL